MTKYLYLLVLNNSTNNFVEGLNKKFLMGISAVCISGFIGIGIYKYKNEKKLKNKETMNKETIVIIENKNTQSKNINNISTIKPSKKSETSKIDAIENKNNEDFNKKSENKNHISIIKPIKQPEILKIQNNKDLKEQFLGELVHIRYSYNLSKIFHIQMGDFNKGYMEYLSFAPLKHEEVEKKQIEGILLILNIFKKFRINKIKKIKIYINEHNYFYEKDGLFDKFIEELKRFEINSVTLDLFKIKNYQILEKEIPIKIKNTIEYIIKNFSNINIKLNLLTSNKDEFNEEKKQLFLNSPLYKSLKKYIDINENIEISIDNFHEVIFINKNGIF